MCDHAHLFYYNLGSLNFEKKILNNICFSYNFLASLLDIFKSCLYHVDWFNYYLTFYWIKFLYEIWDYYNQALFYVNVSDFTPFIRLWIVFLDWILKICISFSWRNSCSPSTQIKIWTIYWNAFSSGNQIQVCGIICNSYINHKDTLDFDRWWNFWCSW